MGHSREELEDLKRQCREVMRERGENQKCNVEGWIDGQHYKDPEKIAGNRGYEAFGKLMSHSAVNSED